MGREERRERKRDGGGLTKAMQHRIVLRMFSIESISVPSSRCICSTEVVHPGPPPALRVAEESRDQTGHELMVSWAQARFWRVFGIMVCYRAADGSTVRQEWRAAHCTHTERQ